MLESGVPYSYLGLVSLTHIIDMTHMIDIDTYDGHVTGVTDTYHRHVTGVSDTYHRHHRLARQGDDRLARQEGGRDSSHKHTCDIQGTDTNCDIGVTT